MFTERINADHITWHPVVFLSESELKKHNFFGHLCLRISDLSKFELQITFVTWRLSLQQAVIRADLLYKNTTIILFVIVSGHILHSLWKNDTLDTIYLVSFTPKRLNRRCLNKW